MQLADLPEGKRFALRGPAGETGRLIRVGPEWAVVRMDVPPIDRVTQGPYVTNIRADTEIEPLPE